VRRYLPGAYRHPLPAYRRYDSTPPSLPDTPSYCATPLTRSTVWIKSGLCSADSLINIALCCLGYLPGLIHAWYIIAKYPERDCDYEPIPDSERGPHSERVTYYYVSRTPAPQAGGPPGGYGTQAAPKPVPPVPQQPQQPRQPQSGVGAGPSTGAVQGVGAPPSYSDAVKGDNKVQTQD